MAVNPTHIGIKDSIAISVIKPEHNCRRQPCKQTNMKTNDAFLTLKFLINTPNQTNHL